MSTFFNNFLTGLFGADGYMKDFAHASRLYRDDNFYDLAPKAGWMYYVRLGINPAIRTRLETVASGWTEQYQPFVGILAKAADLPRFTVATETINQYNRKTVIQTKLTYQPVSITFHDDMANATTDLWKAYYRYYYADGNVMTSGSAKTSKTSDAFQNTKYLDNTSYAYGLANGQTLPFFNSIEIFLLNKKKYSSVTLINPIIKEWGHSSVDQSSNKLMENKMTVEYESVIYNTGRASQVGFTSEHYDPSPSPLAIAGNGQLFGDNGIIAGAENLFGDVSNINQDTSFMDIVKMGLQASQLANSIGKITAAGLQKEGFSLLMGELGLGTTGRYEGGNSSNNGPVVGGMQYSPNATVNTFKQYYNTSVTPSIKSKPRKLTIQRRTAQ